MSVCNASDWVSVSWPSPRSFAPVRSSQVRLDLTSAAAGTAAGFLQIVELQVLSGGTAVT